MKRAPITITVADNSRVYGSSNPEFAVTVSANHDINPYFGCLGLNGVLAVVGLPDMPASVHHAAVIMGNKTLTGSLIGGIPETQEMLDFCAEHKIVSDIETIPIQKINEAYERMLKSDVKYRFVINMESLKK